MAAITSLLGKYQPTCNKRRSTSKLLCYRREKNLMPSLENAELDALIVMNKQKTEKKTELCEGMLNHACIFKQNKVDDT